MVVFGTGDVQTLQTLVHHLARERDSFTTVEVLLTAADSWRFSSAWRKKRGRLPAWCRLTPILGGDPVAPCLERLSQAREAVTVFLDGGLMVCTPGALTQLAGWLQRDDGIAFASGVTVLDGDRVVEAGCVLDEAGIAHPLFRGEPLHQWTVFGGPLWRRNVETASPNLLAVRTADIVRALAVEPRSGWSQVFHAACRRLVDEREGGRGVVEPNARAVMASDAISAAPALVGRIARYLHPYLTLGSQGEIVLVKDLPHEAAIDEPAVQAA